jgi:N utilization substance protein B
MRSGKGDDLARIAGQVWDDLLVSDDERKLASEVIRAVIIHRAELDSDLIEVTSNWRLERLGAIERSVLRLGAAELKSAQTPPRVVIKEAVKLAERFGSAESAKFVNGVLDAYARRAGLLQ